MADLPRYAEPSGEGMLRSEGPVWWLFDRLLVLAAAIAALILALMTLLITWSVISRKWFGNPVSWNVELSEYALLYVTFLASAWVLQRGEHVKVDLIVDTLPPSARRVLHVLNNAMGLAVTLALAWFTFSATAQTYAEGQLLIKTFTVPKWLTMAIMPVGFVLLSIQFARNVLAAGRAHRQGPVRSA